MLEPITKKQKALCESCHYRDRLLEKIVFCPYVRNCKRAEELKRAPAVKEKSKNG